jgi:hypothetical protein
MRSTDNVEYSSVTPQKTHVVEIPSPNVASIHSFLRRREYDDPDEFPLLVPRVAGIDETVPRTRHVRGRFLRSRRQTAYVPRE